MTDSTLAVSQVETSEAKPGSGGLLGTVLLAVSIASAATMQGAFSTVQEAAKADLKLTDFDLSLVQGLAVAIPIAVLSVPLGRMVDRTNRMRLMIVMSILWTTGTLATAFAPNMPLLFLARMITGLGSTCAVIAAISIAADLCRPAQRGRAMMILTLGKNAGGAAAFALGGWLFGVFLAQGMFGMLPWRSVHIALAGLSAVLTLALLPVKEPRRQETEAGADIAFASVMKVLWDRKAFLIPLFAGQISVTMADAAAAIWAAPVLSRNFGLSPEQFAGWMGGVMLLSGIGGAVIGGLSADAGHKSRIRGGILLGAVIASGVALPAAIFPLMPTPLWFGVALTVLLLGGTVTGLVTATAISVLLPNEVRGLCLGLFLAVAGVIAFGVAPSLVTAVSGIMGGDQFLAPALALVGTAVSILSFLTFLLAMRNAPETATAQPIG